MSDARFPKYSDIFSAKSTTGVGNVIKVNKEQHIGFDLWLTDNGAGQTATIKVRATFDPDCDLTAAASETNRWFYTQFTSYTDSVTLVYAGDTGVTITTEAVTGYNIDTFGYYMIAPEITAITNAAITGGCLHVNNY